jgi:hypothetical protein
MTKEVYHKYLNSPEWKDKREGFLSDPYWGRENRCLICSSKKYLVIHHLTYEHVGKELEHEVCILCNQCHDTLHKTHKAKTYNLDVFSWKIAGSLGVYAIKPPKLKKYKFKKKKKVKQKALGIFERQALGLAPSPPRKHRVKYRTIGKTLFMS